MIKHRKQMIKGGWESDKKDIILGVQSIHDFNLIMNVIF